MTGFIFLVINDGVVFKRLCVTLQSLGVFLCGKKLTAKEDAKSLQSNAKELHCKVDIDVLKITSTYFCHWQPVEGRSIKRVEIKHVNKFS